MAMGQWNTRPDKHRRERLDDGPSNPVQSPDQDITPLLIAEHRFFDAILWSVQRNDTCDLQRLKNAVVEVTFNLGQRSDHFAISHTEAYPPPRHIVGLGECVELHSNVFRSVHLQKA